VPHNIAQGVGLVERIMRRIMDMRFGMRDVRTRVRHNESTVGPMTQGWQ
jgi:hypothetical protein